jgi:tRNA pseudouridine38-40 synthase
VRASGSYSRGVSYAVRLTVAYDGTEFAGFQRQPDQRTVASELAAAAQRICRHEVAIRAASRTDAGVHAEGQIAAFNTERELSPERWASALNRYLPPDIAVRSAEACAVDYEPRFDARNKTYRYLFNIGTTRDPLLHTRAWHLGQRTGLRSRGPGSDGLLSIDLPAMREACTRLQGTYDFRAFRASADRRENTQRTLTRVELHENYAARANLLALEVQGDSFMMNMVRILAGTLVDVGRGRMTPDDVAKLLTDVGDRRDGGATAPAHGLTLVAVTLGRLHAEASRSAP